mmetsp:Transcript_18112/g.51845  ORF Transcript_18112/g.51845 Transcript_18112/m.51845 type:complete len:449 (+) Transcript_18112:778-2124(+)
MLAQDDAGTGLRFTTHQTDGLRRHDLVRRLVLDHAVLMDSGLVLEGVGPHDGLVGLALHPGVLGHHLGRGRDVDGIDAAVQLPGVAELLPSLEGEGHDDLLERGVAGPLADAVDGAFQLPRTIQGAGEGVGGGQPQIVVAVGGEDDLVGPGDVVPELLDDLAELPRHVPTRRVGDVEGGSTGLDGGAQHAVQKVGFRPSGILGAELNVVAAQTLGEFDGVYGNVHDLVGSFLQLVLHVNLAGGDEGVDPRPFGPLDGIPRDGNVLLVGPGKAADYGYVSIVVHLPSYRIGNLLDGIEIVGTGNGKARLNDVDSQLGEVAGNLDLFGRRQGRSRRLFAVPERRVEDPDVVRIGDVSWDVFRPRTALQVRVVVLQRRGVAVGGGTVGSSFGGRLGRAENGAAAAGRRRRSKRSTSCAGYGQRRYGGKGVDPPGGGKEGHEGRGRQQDPHD